MQAVRFFFHHHQCWLRSFTAQAAASSPSSRLDTTPTAVCKRMRSVLLASLRNGKHFVLLRWLFIPTQPHFVQRAFLLFSATGCRSWSPGCWAHWHTRRSETISKKRRFCPRKLTWSSCSTCSRVLLLLTVASMSTSAKILSTACRAKSSSQSK